MENDSAVQKMSGGSISRSESGNSSAGSLYPLQGVPNHHIMQQILQQPPGQPPQFNRMQQYSQQTQPWRGGQHESQYSEHQLHSQLVPPMYQQQQIQAAMHDSLGAHRDRRQQQAFRLPFNMAPNTTGLHGQDIDTTGSGGGDTSEYPMAMLQRVAHPQLQPSLPAASTQGVESLSTDVHGQVKSMAANMFLPGQYHPGNPLAMAPLQDGRMKPVPLFTKLGPPPHRNLPPPPHNKEGCHCRKSRCLKLYCLCFSSQAMCHLNCKCLHCANHPGEEKARQNALKNIQSRNPDAFARKFTTNESSSTVKLENKFSHTKGCKCRKSLCLKKYCECFSGGVKSGTKCQCIGCLNREESLVGYENSAIEGKRDSSVLFDPGDSSRVVPTDQRYGKLDSPAGDGATALLNGLSRTTVIPMIGENMTDGNNEVKGRPAKRQQVSLDEKASPPDQKAISSEPTSPTEGLFPNAAQRAAPHDLILAASELACLKQPGGDDSQENSREV